MNADIVAILNAAKVIPVLEIENAADAAPLASALVEGGLSVIEVTLRTPAALEAIETILHEVPGCIVGVGTIRDRDAYVAARASGAAFGVSPGMTPDLLHAVSNAAWPFLPGVTTISEVMTLRAHGLTVQKLFPATLMGGPAYLKAIAGPVPEVRFCPTGGITADNAAEFLALENVLAVGGSWIATRQLISDRNWDAITERARAISA